MRLPLFGIGTYQLEDVNVLRSVIRAVLPLGVRMIDTAQWYMNEAQIAEVLSEELPKHNLTRSDVIIVSKVHPKNHGYERCMASSLESIAHFGYLDMMLVHWPMTTASATYQWPGMDKSQDTDIRTLRAGTWRALEELMKAGKVRGIGVSNYTVEHLDELLEYSTTGPPSVLQSEFHPRCHQHGVIEYCVKHGIQFMGYTPLGRRDLLGREIVVELAGKYGISPGQVLLKWSMQKGAVTIPRSSSAERNVENTISWTDGIVLSGEDMAKLDELDDEHHYTWNPNLL